MLLSTAERWIARILQAALVCGTLLSGFVATSSRGTAEEPVREFLAALREKHYYDEALYYLENSAENPLVPIDFRASVKFERGVTLIDASKYKKDVLIREKDLDSAQVSLREFIEENPNHVLMLAARSQLGNVTVERGKFKVERAKKKTGTERTTLMKEAAVMFNEAIKVFGDLKQELFNKIDAMPKIIDEKKDAKLAELRDQLRTDYLQSMLLLAASREELAEAVEPGTKEHTDTLTAAAKEYGEIYDKYRTRMAGLYARMYQGRCLTKMQKQKDNGNLKDAITKFNELFAIPDSDPAVRTLKMGAYNLAAKAWMDLGEYATVLEKAGKWVDDVRPSESRTPEVQWIRMAVAQACLKINAKDPKAKESIAAMRTGRDLVKAAAALEGPWQNDARNLLTSFSAVKDDAGPKIQGVKEPKNFDEARDFGKETLESLQSAQLTIRTVPQRLQVEKDAGVRSELEKQLDEAKKTADTAVSQAAQYFKFALGKSQADTPDDDLNAVRYYLCFLNYNLENYYEALVYGEFLARRFPDSGGARQGALIAMASCQKLYGENKSDDKSFESEKIQSIAEYIVTKWPDQKEAEEALNTLIPFMIKAGRLDEAQAYVKKIPAESKHRGMAELKTGQALWAKYLTNAKEIREKEADLETWKKEGTPEGVVLSEVQAEITKMKGEQDTLKTRAEATLVEGYNRQKASNEVNAVVAGSSLSLSQVYIDTDKSTEAIATLNDPAIGALTLVKKADPAVQREGFAEEVYRTALRAYISSLAKSKDPEGTIKNAKDIMEGLKQRLGTTPLGQAKIVAIYVALARDLQTQLEIADDSVRGNLAKGFEAFLQQVATEATELNILNWVGQTYHRMAESFGRDANGLPKAEAKPYFQKAVDTYVRILDLGAKNPTFFGADAVKQAAVKSAVQRQLAMTYRDLGKFKESADTFKIILAAQNGMLPVQMEAAYNYQRWAGASDDERITKMYESAMGGARDPATNKSIIWGWIEIANKTAGDSRFRSHFFEARYNLAHCRYKYGMSTKDATKKKELINRARLDIELTQKLFADMGGDQWRPKFDTLLKTIQRELGDKSPKGLKAIEVAPAAPTTPATTAGAVPGKAAAPATTSAATPAPAASK